MSRKGNIPVAIPKGVKVKIDNGKVLVEGSNGKSSLNIPRELEVQEKEDSIFIRRRSDEKQVRADHGTAQAKLVNMMTGVTTGHKKELEIQGIGFRAQLQGKKIVFNLGFSHPVEYPVPDDLKIAVPTQTSIIIEGVDLQRVGQVAAEIRALKPVEPYKGKGIRYLGEFVRRKQGKSVTK